MSPFEAVREFHRIFGQPIADAPTLPAPELQQARKEMAAEEMLEYAAEVNVVLRSPRRAIQHMDEHVARIARELADQVYIAYGTALCYGIDLDAVIAEVHIANMAKAKGGVHKRPDGKVLKPPGWYPPDIERVIFGR